MSRNSLRTWTITAALLSACSPPPSTPARRVVPAAKSQRIEATVITVQTRGGPGAGVSSHQVVLANDRMRIGNELDQWRLFDLKNDAVTWVDDIERTYRTVPGAALRRDALEASQLPLPDGVDEAQWLTTGARRRIAGVDAVQHMIRAGGYQRQLWVGSVPGIPNRFLSLALATDSNRGPYSGLMKRALPPMLGLSGFILLDSAELPAAKLAVEKIVTAIDRQPIPAAWLSIPAGYSDVSPKLRGSGAGRPRASSLRPGRNTPAVEWPPSGTVQKTP